MSENKPMTPSEQIAYLQKLASYYNEKGEDALMEDIMKSVTEEKAAGKLTDEMIINMANMMARFLSQDQKMKLFALVNDITSKKIQE